VGDIERPPHTAESALELAHAAHIPELEARALARVAVTLARLETPETSRRAVELAQRALALSDERGALASSLWQLGNVFLFLNDLDRAERLYDDALASTESSRDELLGAHCLANMGMLAFRRFALDEAIERTQQALSRYQRIGHRPRIQEMTHNLGAFHHLRGEHEVGKQLLDAVLAEAQGDWILTTSCEEQLADVARVEGDEARAQAYLRDAAEMCERVGVAKKQAIFLGLLAESLWASGDVAGTIAALEHSAQAGEALTLSHAFLLLHLGPLDDAEECLDRFIPTETDPHRRYAAELARARALAWTGRGAGALRKCDELLAQMEDTKVARFYLPARCLHDALAGQFEAALDALEDARRACAPSAHAELILDVGTALVNGGADRGTLQRFEALAHGSGEAAHLGIRHRLEDLDAEIFRRLGDGERARECLASAQHRLEDLFAKLPPDYREHLAEHPWTQGMRRVRSVP
jgi:tetratricopeptide (TPR) repeat protein